MKPLLWIAPLATALAVGFTGCAPEVPKQVVVATTLDDEATKTIFDAFTRQTGIAVVATPLPEPAETDAAEALKQADPLKQVDVVWNGDPLGTLLLKRAGKLRQQPLAADAQYPADSRSPDYDWRGLAARARVLLVNKNLVKEARWPRSIEDLTDPQWYDRCGVAHPLAGASAAHAAALFQGWGVERAQRFYTGVKKNCRILSDERRVALGVASGDLVFGLTTSDAAIAVLEGGQPVEIIYPDQAATAPPATDPPSEAAAPESGASAALGVFYFPSTVAMVEGGPTPQAGQALAEFLLTSLVECRLVIGPGAHVPLSRQSRADNACRCRIKTPDDVKAMAIDWDAAAAGWGEASEWLEQEFGAAP